MKREDRGEYCEARDSASRLGIDTVQVQLTQWERWRLTAFAAIAVKPGQGRTGGNFTGNWSIKIYLQRGPKCLAPH